MIVLEMKAVVQPSQCSAIDEAIRTVQFIRNKALRLWVDAKREDKIDKYSLNFSVLKHSKRNWKKLLGYLKPDKS